MNYHVVQEVYNHIVEEKVDPPASGTGKAEEKVRGGLPSGHRTLG